MKSIFEVAAVSYLNARPLIHTLGQSDRLAIHLSSPAECSDRLLSGQADVALIPSIEYSRLRKSCKLEIVPDIAIVSKGAVQSVELFFNTGIANVSRIAVDSSSRTSVALLRIILSEKFDIQPEFIPMPPDLQVMFKQADAALIIGDPALELAGRFDNRLDLGEEWGDLTDGLPFVYAFWAARAGRLSTESAELFLQSQRDGLVAIPQIAAAYAATHGKLQAERYENYLHENISYEFGAAEQDGLLEYYSYCFYYGLINEVPDLHFIGDPVSS